MSNVMHGWYCPLSAATYTHNNAHILNDGSYTCRGRYKPGWTELMAGLRLSQSLTYCSISLYFCKDTGKEREAGSV
jgi:hypothetical protein